MRRAFSRLPLGTLCTCALLAACDSGDGTGGGDELTPDGGSSQVPDAGDLDTPAAPRVLYPFDRRHSPMPATIVDRLAEISATAPRSEQVFAKVGDSMTHSVEFLRCFDGGYVDLGEREALGSTIEYYLSGDAGGVTPFIRTSDAAYNGATAETVLQGAPAPIDTELAAIPARLGVIMLGTNDVRRGRTLAAFAADLWEVTARMLANGTIPLLSTIPANPGDEWADAMIPRFNLAIRGLAQGLQVPFVDLHRSLSPLPNRGIGSDGVHMSVAPAGGCSWATADLEYGYNLRNLVTIEMLRRVRAALRGIPGDDTAETLAGTGTSADPFVVSWPYSDLGDTRTGEATITDHGCSNAPAQPGKELVYTVELPSQVRLHAEVITRAGTGVDVDVHVLADGTCRGSGDSSVIVTVGPGPVQIIVDTPSAAGEGEFLLVLARRAITPS